MTIVESDPIVECDNGISWKTPKSKDTLPTVWKLQGEKHIQNYIKKGNLVKRFILIVFMVL